MAEHWDEPKRSSVRYAICLRGDGAAKRRAGKDGLTTRKNKEEETPEPRGGGGHNH
jgi:hypothetical protein